MSFRSKIAGALLLTFALALPTAPIIAAGAQPGPTARRHAAADLILVNGVVRTQSRGQPLAQAVAVSAGLIGLRRQQRRRAGLARPGDRSRPICTAGPCCPGWRTPTCTRRSGEFLNHRLCDVHAYSVEEGFARLRHCAGIAPAGDWVVGYGWYDLDNAAFDGITRAELDALVPDRKLAVISKDLHTLWVNSKTLAEFGIGRDRRRQPAARSSMTRRPANQPAC